MSATPRFDFRKILRTLADHRVEFVVVGGIGAVLQGAPLTTFDLEIVHSTSEVNVDRLVDAVEELEAVYRAQPERRLHPDRSRLASPGHQLLVTKHGPLDALGSAGKSRRFEDLAGDAGRIDLGDNLSVLVLRLEVLVQLKEETGRPEDLAALPVLRKTIEQRQLHQK